MTRVSKMIIHSLFLLAATLASASTLHPPVLPLIVRNPYLSTWLGNARDYPWKHWPIFWTGEEIGFSVMAYRPDNKTVYPLLGRAYDSLRRDADYVILDPIYNGASFDASTTNLTYSLGITSDPDSVVNVTLSFLSPITPTSTFRQSLPAAYMAVHLQGEGNISLYTDVNGQWVTGSRNNEIQWRLLDSQTVEESSAPLKSWAVSRRTEQLLAESSDRAEWGTLRFSGPQDAHHQAGTSAILRQQFVNHGKLLDTIDNNFRKVMDEEPVFAFSKTFSLGKPSNDSSKEPGHSSILFSLALVQDPVVQFAAARGLTYMRPLWASFIPTADTMIAYHYNDFQTAFTLARNYSQQLDTDAKRLGTPGFEQIIALSARQVLGATQFSGTPEDPILFLKEISSNGNFQTVDVIFPAFPFFLYTNPKWLAYLLEPLIEHQLSGQYPNDYSMHDLGTHFPNATGHLDGRDEYMPVEECGNMLIMALALVNALTDQTKLIPGGLSSGLRVSWDNEAEDALHDPSPSVRQSIAKDWAHRGYRLWKQWTGYLVRESLIPRNQLCTDDFAGWLANQTNLALKGIIGIRAMSQIAELVGEHDDARHYRNISDAYITQWQEYGFSRDGTHAKLSYTWYGSWTTIYNLYADALLCFHIPSQSTQEQAGDQKPLQKNSDKLFIPNKIYSKQSTWYYAVLQRYGLPLDSRHLYTKSDWQLFAAAVASQKTRNAIIEAIALWVTETVTDRPLTDLYDTEGEGDFSPVRFMARPVVGGHFASLALQQACGGDALRGLDFLEEGPFSTIDTVESLRTDAEGMRML
ncbi:putative glutaminase [Paramyrothecium foliicola]|nr:putative glutaminase [Paramyrothecium foliicola]